MVRKDIDLQDLIKIVSEIQEKDRQKKVSYENNSLMNFDFDTLKKEFDQKTTINEKLIFLKKIERNYPLNNSAYYLDLFLIEARLLEKEDIRCDIENSYQSRLKEINFKEKFLGFNNISVIRMEKYLAYRTNIRAGVIPYYDAQFMLLYIYELFFQIGVKDEYDGFDMLFFVLTYFINDANWVRDFAIRTSFEYIIEHNINLKNTSSYSKYREFIYKSIIHNYKELFLKKYYLCDGTKCMNKIIDLYYYTYYHSTNSDEKLKNELMKVFPDVLKKVTNYLTSKNVNINDLLYQKEIKTYQTNYVNKTELLSGTILLFDEFSISYKTDLAREISYYEYRIRPENEKVLKYICGEIEYYYQEKNQLFKKNRKKFPDEFNITIDDKKLSDIITNIVKGIMGVSLNKEFTLDTSKLDSIRQISDEVSMKLITEFDMEDEPIEQESLIINQDESDDEWGLLAKNLNDSQIELLTKINNNESIVELNKFAAKYHTLLEVMIENINDVAGQLIGDSLIDATDEDIYIYDEYKEQITNLKGGDRK